METPEIQHNDQGFAGTLRKIALTDIIQMCCLSASSLSIRVTQGEHIGTITIRDGEVVHAESGDQCGEEAFFKIMCWQSGSFETLEIEPQTEETINSNYSYLIMEASRRIDEQGLNEEDAAVKMTIDEPKLRVLIVDDSSVMTRILSSMYTAQQDIEVVGKAKNGEEAMRLMDELKPDLITLDVNMPVMDGKTTLKHIMIKNPCPVVIMSNVGSSSQNTILQFLNLGAVDFISKPVKDSNILNQQQVMVKRLHQAAQAKVNAFKRLRPSKVISSGEKISASSSPCQNLIIVNSGGGGHAQLQHLAPLISTFDDTGIIYLQTLPNMLAAAFAENLDKHSFYDLVAISDGMPLCGQRAYVGTHDCTIRVGKRASGYLLNHADGVCQHALEGEAFGQLLESIEAQFEGRLFVVLLSGAEVGSLDALHSVRSNNGVVIVQNPETCMMPYSLEKVIEQGLVDAEANLEDIPKELGHYMGSAS